MLPIEAYWRGRWLTLDHWHLGRWLVAGNCCFFWKRWIPTLGLMLCWYQGLTVYVVWTQNVKRLRKLKLFILLLEFFLLKLFILDWARIRSLKNCVWHCFAYFFMPRRLCFIIWRSSIIDWLIVTICSVFDLCSRIFGIEFLLLQICILWRQFKHSVLFWARLVNFLVCICLLPLFLIWRNLLAISLKCLVEESCGYRPFWCSLSNWHVNITILSLDNKMI